MSSMSALIPGARVRMRLLQLRLNVAGSPQFDDTLVSWDDSCLPDLWWWSDVSHLQAGLPLLPLGPQQPSLFLFTDALDTGWVASLGDSPLVMLVVSGLLRLFDQPPRVVGGSFSLCAVFFHFFQDRLVAL